MADVKGMVQVAGATYRIVKVSRGKYDVIRILDEAKVGSFETVPKVTVRATGVSEKLLLEISMTALKQAKISWQRMPGPKPFKSVPSMPKAAPSAKSGPTAAKSSGPSATRSSAPPQKIPSSRPSQTRPSSTRMRAGKPS
jgi:hypothetical protein